MVKITQDIRLNQKRFGNIPSVEISYTQTNTWIIIKRKIDIARCKIDGLAKPDKRKRFSREH